LKRSELKGNEFAGVRRIKEFNPLIAIPCAPGVRKTAFPVFFLVPSAYQEYCGENVNAVVSTLSFNGDMGVTSAGHIGIIGIRILYGAMRGMGSYKKNQKCSVNSFTSCCA